MLENKQRQCRHWEWGLEKTKIMAKIVCTFHFNRVKSRSHVSGENLAAKKSQTVWVGSVDPQHNLVRWIEWDFFYEKVNEETLLLQDILKLHAFLVIWFKYGLLYSQKVIYGFTFVSMSDGIDVTFGLSFFLHLLKNVKGIEKSSLFGSGWWFRMTNKMSWYLRI